MIPFLSEKSPVPIGYVAGWNALEKGEVPCPCLQSKSISTTVKLLAVLLLLLLFLLHYPTILFGLTPLFYFFLPRGKKLRIKVCKYFFIRIAELLISKKSAGIQTIINLILKCTS